MMSVEIVFCEESESCQGLVLFLMVHVWLCYLLMKRTFDACQFLGKEKVVSEMCRRKNMRDLDKERKRERGKKIGEKISQAMPHNSFFMV